MSRPRRTNRTTRVALSHAYEWARQATDEELRKPQTTNARREAARVEMLRRSRIPDPADPEQR